MPAVSPRVRNTMASVVISSTALVLAFGYESAAFYRIAYAFPVILLLSAVLVHSRSMAAQLFVRATWWASAVVGVALAVAWAPIFSAQAAAVSALGASLALLMLGGTAALPNGRSLFFAPRAGRTTFTLALVLGACSALTLGYFAILYTESHLIGQALSSGSHTLLLGGLAAAQILALTSLFGMRVVGWVASVGLTVVVGSLALAGVFEVPATINVALAVVGGLALISQLPLCVALLRGKGVRPAGARC